MKPFLALFHTTLNAVDPMMQAIRKESPELTVQHYMDEGLLSRFRAGEPEDQLLPRFQYWMEAMEKDGAKAILMTCSSFSPLAPRLRACTSLPLMSIDDAMINAALHRGRHIGVVSTLSTAAPITCALLTQRAREQSLQVETESCVVESAFDALQSHDPERHDKLVQDAILKIQDHVDVVLLSQISMTRALQNAPDFTKPILTSAESSARQAAKTVSNEQ